jgi:hypothetical protein
MVGSSESKDRFQLRGVGSLGSGLFAEREDAAPFSRTPIPGLTRWVHRRLTGHAATSARRRVAGPSYGLPEQAVAPKTPLRRVTLENAEESISMESTLIRPEGAI